MKKLMFIATAALCGAVMAEGEIVSANVVGYAQNGMNVGEKITLITSQFFGVGSADGKFSINDLKCGDEAAEAVTLMTLDEYGQPFDQYLWVDGEWFDLTGEGAGSYNPGVAFWVQCDLSSGSSAIQSAGQVGTADVEIELNGDENITLVGNSYPVQLPISDILCSDNASEAVTLMMLDEDGQPFDQFLWVDGAWIDIGGTEKTHLNPGESCWVQCDLPSASGTVTITLPGVEL